MAVRASLDLKVGNYTTCFFSLFMAMHISSGLKLANRFNFCCLVQKNTLFRSQIGSGFKGLGSTLTPLENISMYPLAPLAPNFILKFFINSEDRGSINHILDPNCRVLPNY